MNYDLLNPALARLWESHKRSIEGLSKFSRFGGRFPLTAVGKINTYSIFAETARSICSPDGRVGMIVPSGIATDDTTKVFFADLVNRQSLVSLYDFENREGVFPGVHRSYKFCLLTLTGADSPSPQAEFAFFLHRTEQLHDAGRRFALSPADLALYNPNTRTCPVFRTRHDADIAAKLYRRAGVFWKEARGGEPEANPWGVNFSQMFNMTSDSGCSAPESSCRVRAGGWKVTCSSGVMNATCRCTRPSCSISTTTVSPHLTALMNVRFRLAMPGSSKQRKKRTRTQ